MIYFHEGLPRSGKSYEAITRHLFKAVKESRPCLVYVEGINHQRISECTGVPVETVQQLVETLTRDEVRLWYQRAKPNALVILDEAQNFWPSSRQKLDEASTQAITEHGHLGQDIILMGQDARDVHPIWRRRIEIKVVFNKLSALGQEGRYSAKSFRAISPEKYEELRSDVGKYNKEWFGCYSSHVSGDINTANYKDSRATIWGSPLVRLGIPAAVLVAGWGVWTVYGYFKPAPAPVVASSSAAAGSAPVKPAGVAPAASPAAQPAPRRELTAADLVAIRQTGVVRELLARHTARLALWYVAADGLPGCVIELWAPDRLAQSLTCWQMRRLGESPALQGDTLHIAGHRITPYVDVPRTASTDRTVAAASPAPAPRAE